jgi:hypothetical protein
LTEIPRLTPRDESHNPAAEENRVLWVHALIVAMVVACATGLSVLGRIDAAVVATILGSALTFGGTRSSQVSGRVRRADQRRREDDRG